MAAVNNTFLVLVGFPSVCVCVCLRSFVFRVRWLINCVDDNIVYTSIVFKEISEFQTKNCKLK